MYSLRWHAFNDPWWPFAKIYQINCMWYFIFIAFLLSILKQINFSLKGSTGRLKLMRTKFLFHQNFFLYNLILSKFINLFRIKTIKTRIFNYLFFCVNICAPWINNLRRNQPIDNLIIALLSIAFDAIIKWFCSFWKEFL